MYLLDTDIIIYALNGNEKVISRFKEHNYIPKAISSITYGELIYGAQKSKKKIENTAKVHQLKDIFPILDATQSVMETYGSLKAKLECSGIVIDDFDLLIGATAITHGYCVVTNNEKHFSKISGLKIINWAK